MEELSLSREEVLNHLKHILGPQIFPTEEELDIFIKDLRKIMREDQARQCSNENKENLACQCYCHNTLTQTPMDCPLPDSPTERSYATTAPSETGKSLIVPEKPLPSFIRPWRTKVRAKTKTAKEDPVRLFNNYKDLWSRQRFPGEASHAGVRWNVRGQMLGQEPEPRNEAAGSEFQDENMKECDCADNPAVEESSRPCSCPCPCCQSPCSKLPKTSSNPCFKKGKKLNPHAKTGYQKDSNRNFASAPAY